MAATGGANPTPRTGPDHPEDRLWSRDFVLTIGVNFFIAMVFYLLMTTMAMYAVERFAASDSAAGLASGSFIIGALVARVFTGKALDLVGRRRMLMISLGLFVGASLFYLPATHLAVLLLVRLVHGAAFGAASTTVSASVMALIPVRRRGEGTGYFLLSTTLASAIGPLIALTAISRAGYQALFTITVGCCVAGLMVALLVNLPQRTPTADELANRWRLRRGDVLDRHALPVTSIVFVSGAAFSGILAFVNSYAQQVGLLSAAGSYFLVYAGFVLLSRMAAGRFQDSRGDNAVIYPALLAFAAGLAVLAVATTGVLLLTSAALVGLGFGALVPSTQAVAVTMAPEARVGVATSTFFIMLDLGTGLGPLILGAMVTQLGFRGMYLGLVGFVLSSTLAYHLTHGHKRYVRRLHT